MPRSRTKVGNLFREYQTLTDDEKDEFDLLYVDEFCTPVHRLKMEDLMPIVVGMPRRERDRFVGWVVSLAVPAMATYIENALNSLPPGPKSPMAERDAWIMAQKDAGQKPGEMLQELKRRGKWANNAKGRPLTTENIRTIIKRERRKDREED